MELRHQHRHDRGNDAEAEEKTRRERELEQPRWPGKKSRTEALARFDARTPDLKRIREALGSLRNNGAPLPGAMTAQYSQLLGLDLSDVRIHRGGAAGQAAKTLDATAFTAGTNIVVADHLDLDSAFGRHVIAHELVHVAQNKRSGIPMDLAAHADVGPSGSAVEQEAERGAVALNRGESFTVQAHGRLPGISRYGGDETPPPGASAPVTLPSRTPAPTRPDNTPTPPAQETPAQPAPAPAPPAPAATAAPTAQPRPTDQPGNTPTAPATPAPGTPGYNQPSGSAPAPSPTVPGSTTPRPAPAPAPTPAPAASLDARVQQELETRADPTLKAGYARAVAGVDALRIQALQYSFTPSGVWNTLVETFTARNAFQDHFGQIYSANAYRGGNSWADTAQAWIEGLRGVVHIIGDVASVISAWAGLVALVTGALALILSETVIGGIALGAIAAIAAEVALVAGAIKLLTDIIDLLLGIIQMIILVVRARNSKDPAQRARFAALLRKESNDFGANVVSIGVQVAVMAVTAGIGAGMSRGANSFMSAFKDEFSKMITPALKPWTLGNNFRNIARMATPVAVGTGVRAGRTVLQVEVDQGLVGINRQARVGSRITRTREVIPFTARNQMNGARLVTMRNVVGRQVIINGAGVAVGLGSGQLQVDIKQPRAANGGTSASGPAGAGNGGRLNAPAQPAGADLSKVSMWPSQIEAFENAKGPIGSAVDRTQRQYEMAESQAGPELAGQVRQAFAGANNQAGQMRFGAMQVQTDAREGQANTQRGLQQTTQAGTQQQRMGATQDSANRNVQRIQGEGTKLQSPPPKEGVLGWLYNQTIGRIGNWIGSAQRWVTNLVGKWAMSLAGFSKEEMDIAGIENDMREDDKKDQTSTQEAQDAATRADQIQQTVFTLQENKTRDEQYAIQAMADSQRFIQALEDAERQLTAAITNGQSYIATVTPVIAHELQTEQAGAAIDAQYVAPLVAYATSFSDSIDASNIGASARTDGNGALAQMKAAYPELDIAPGTTAIGNAAGQYDAAFGQLAGQARGQVAAMQTAIQAFIGTQDYDGVGGNAAALDALASDFDAAAQRLADQLYAAINSTITQYNAHIQRAIDAANAVPADQPAADTAPPPPAAEPAPADADATGFGSGYAKERQGVTATPAAVSEVKAPVADNAAKPATGEAAKAEKEATPPPENQAPAPEKADVSGQKPAANDGTPAKDDPAKAGAVDKPRGEEAKPPATAKPFGTPKANASKSEADKTDADKLDLGGAPPTGGGSEAAEPAPSAPKTGKRAASTKPQETPIEEPVTTPITSASTSAAAPKPKADRKAPKKIDKAGGGISTSAGVSEDAQVLGEDEEGAVDSEGFASGFAGGGYSTTGNEDGYATGEGQPGTASPAQSASGATTDAEVTHTTEATATGAGDDRTTVGVGEKVTFESTEAGSWTATSVGPGGAATKRSSHNYEWVAPATASSVTVTVTPAGGTAKSIDMTVIAPSGIDFESPQEQSYPNGTQGAGMITNVRYAPTTVSFYRTQWKEIGGPASGATGYFAGRTLPRHRPNPNWLQIGDDNGGPTDHASFYGFPAPWTTGTFQWVIPNRYLVNGATGAGVEFAQVTQSCALESDGTTTITKGTATVTRSPGTAPARGGRGRGSGFGSESVNGYGRGEGDGDKADAQAPKGAGLPAPVQVTWNGDPFKITFLRGDTPFGRDHLIFEITYTGGLPTFGGPGVKGNVFQVSVSGDNVFRHGKPLKAKIVSQGAAELALDLYGDDRTVVKLLDKMKPRLVPADEKGREHDFRVLTNGRDFGLATYIVVRDDKTAPAPPKPDHQEDIPGEEPKSFVKNGGRQIRIDGDGDQRKELLLFIKPSAEEYAPQKPKSVTVTVTQLASKKSHEVVLQLPKKDFGGTFSSIVREITDGHAPTQITLLHPDVMLTIPPPSRAADGKVTYTLKGPSNSGTVEFPKEPEGEEPKKVAGTTGEPVAIGGIHGVDLKLGTYNDSFRITVEPNQKVISFSAKERGSGVVGGVGFPLVMTTQFTGIKVLATDGISVALDFDGDGKADVQIFDKMQAMHDGVPAEQARRHNVRLVGPAVGEQYALFRLESNSFHGPFARPNNDRDQQASSNAQAVTGLQDQAGLGSYQANMDAFEGAMFASRMQAADKGIISKELYTAWSTLNGQLLVLRSQIAGKKVDPMHQAACAKTADEMFAALAAATKGKERVVSATGAPFVASTTKKNDYTGEETTESWNIFSGTKTTTNYFARAGTKLRFSQFDPAFLSYNQLVGGLDKWIVEKLKEKGTKEDKEAAQRLEYLGTMRTKLGELEGRNPTRLQAVFHPDSGYKEALRIKEVPLALYYWREGSEWKLRDLTNPNNVFTDEVDAKDGEKEPPASLFKELDYKHHFPKGTIHYQIPNGTGGQLKTTERRTFSEWLTYIGLGVAAIGLGLATFGTGTVAVVGAWTLAASSVIGAAAAAAHMIEESDHGNLSNGEMALDIAQIVAGLVGATQLAAGRLVLSAGAASKAGAAWKGTAALVAKWAQAGYVPLTVARIGADVVTVALGAKELAVQLEQIENSGAPAHEKSRLKALLLSQFAATAGMVALSIKGDLPSIRGGKSLYFYTPKDGGPLVASHFEKPAQIKFSQATVGPSTSDGLPMDKLVAKMKADGWQGDPIDVVQFNGELVSIDNRRLYAARQAGIEAPVTVHKLDDALPKDAIDNARFRANVDIYQLPDGKLTTVKPDPAAVPKIKKGAVAQTWGEGVAIRTANQKGLAGVEIPIGGTLDNPFITGAASPPKEANVPKVAADNDVARIQTKNLQTEIEAGNLDKDIFNKKAPDGTTFGTWYKKWVSDPTPVKLDADGPGKHQPNFPRGMPKEFEPYITRMVADGDVVTNIKINAQAKQIAAEIPDLKTLDPNNAKYPETRKKLVDKHGEDVVKRYESAMFGVEDTAGREAVFGQVKKVVDDTGLDTIRSYIDSAPKPKGSTGGYEIYITGGAANAGKPLSEVSDIKVVIVADGLKPTDLAKLEAWANRLFVKTSPEFATATGKGHLRVNATVRSRKDMFAAMAVDGGANQFARIDTHVPTTAELAHGYQGAKASAGGQANESIPPDVVELLSKELPGLKIDPADARPGIAAYLSKEMNIPNLVVEPLGGGVSGAQVFKVKRPDGSTVGIFKLFRNKEEMLREIGALQKLRDSGVKTMQPVGIGHAANVEGGTSPTGGALMDEASGTIVKDRFKALGAQAPGSSERRDMLSGLKKEVSTVAKGMAEMHVKMGSGREVDPAFKAGEIKWFEDKWNTAVAQGTIPAPDRAVIDPGLRKLVADYRTAKIDATVVHGDGHAGNFAVKGDTVTTFDTETMFRSVGKDGKGTSPAATDVGRFFESIAIQGKQLGMAADEIKAVQKSFLDSYKAASPAANSPDFATATKFYQMNFDLILLRQAAKEAKDKGTPIAREAIDRVIDNLK